MLWRGPMGGGAASGKIGAMIASHCAQGQYLKHRVKCVNPRTELQHPLRNALRSLASMWGTTLTATQRASWATYAANVTWVNRLGDTVHLSGQMEFCRSNWPRFQIGLPLVLSAPVIFDRGSTGGGTITISVGNDFGVFAIQAAPPWQDGSTLTACMVYMGLPRSAARTFMAPRTQLSAVLLGTFGALTAFPPLQPRGNVAQYNQAYPSWLVATYSDGRLTTPTPLTPVFTGPPPPPWFLKWSDAFVYPNGNLWGRDTWGTGGGFTDPQVSSHTLLLAAGTEAKSICSDAAIPDDSTNGYRLDATLSITDTDEPTDNELLFEAGSTPGLMYCNLSWTPGDIPANRLGSLSFGDETGELASFAHVPFTPLTPHTVSVRLTAGVMSIYLDDVLQGSAASATSFTDRFIFIDANASASPNTVTLYELAVFTHTM